VSAQPLPLEEIARLNGEPETGIGPEDEETLRLLVDADVDGGGYGSELTANGSGAATLIDAPPAFVALRGFLDIKMPLPEALIGVRRGGTNLLPRFGWAMMWGPEGSGKTSVSHDAAVHTAAGRDWIDYPTLRPVRWVLVINEGVPGSLQDKLTQKLESWEADREELLDRIAIYTSPWGEFTLQNARMRDHLRDYAHDFEADYVSLDPLHTVGTVGAGSPQDTEAFKHLLRELGLWDSLGVQTIHHANKAGMVSGDWGRHPDTLIRLEKDGSRPATKYTLQKARPADPAELGVVQLLEWETDTLGYRRVQTEVKTPGQTGADNRERVLEAAADGLASVEEIAGHVDLSDRTVTGHLKKLEKAGQLTLAEGARGKLYVASVGDTEAPDDE
jgi:DNA-binding transcriptional ArsR family regulator